MVGWASDSEREKDDKKETFIVDITTHWEFCGDLKFPEDSFMAAS